MTNPADKPSRRADYWTENDAVNALLPTLQHKLRLADGESVPKAMATVFARVRTTRRKKGPTTGEMPATDAKSAPTADKTASSLDAGATECMQYVPRSAARELLTSETGSGDVEESFVQAIAMLQARDEVVAKQKAKADTHRTPTGQPSKWQFDERGLLRHNGRLYVPNSTAMRQEIIACFHDSKLAGHFGPEKTTQLVHRTLYWPEMHADIKGYVATCLTCQRSKAPRRLPFGKLSPLPIPERIWEEISLDLIVGLPPAKKGDNVVYDSILVVVDRLSKMALYIPALEKWNAKDFATVFFEKVGSRFGLPKGIVSDRGTLFTSTFWTEICFQCQMKRKLSTAYHPQTDGQTERQNQTLETYLRMFASETQENWLELLPFAEFTYNNTIHSSTGLSPFYIVYGENPRWTMHEDVHHEGEAPTAIERIETMRNARRTAAEYLQKA